ncbi:MAG: hypothetical protein EA384_03860 [Spirochaetaceae bacterium]|nr:MAG: hypothetical protein EA384_03860 [Spirochaetaceae bacterium]
MCPDEKELLSAYLDGEVPSPWKERLEARLQESPECAAELEQLAAVSAYLHAEPEPDYAASQRAVWKRLANSGLQHRPQPLWGRRVAIPLPLAAAVASLLLLLSAALVWHGGRATVSPADLPIAGGEIDLTIRMGDVSVDELLRIINESETIGEVTVQLPEGARFRFLGEPQLIRAAESRALEPVLVPHVEPYLESDAPLPD